MKNIITLVSMCGLLHPTNAQVLGDTLIMDLDAGATLVLDSVYPAGCWQVGVPNKTLFTTALSLPNALVTDTVQPYPSNTTCYAEFTLLADELTGDFGRWFEFDQWIDLAPGSRAYIEARDTWSSDWFRLNDGSYWSGSVLFGLEGYEFMSSTGGWEHVVFDSPCIGVMNGGQDRWYDPLMRVRFVLEGGDNSSGHDGWMIDDLRVTATMCSGGTNEHMLQRLQFSPNPADEQVLVDLGTASGGTPVQVYRVDGTLVATTPSSGGRLVLDTRELPAGPYLLRTTEQGTGSALLIVTH